MWIIWRLIWNAHANMLNGLYYLFPFTVPFMKPGFPRRITVTIFRMKWSLTVKNRTLIIISIHVKIRVDWLVIGIFVWKRAGRSNVKLEFFSVENYIENKLKCAKLTLISPWTCLPDSGTLIVISASYTLSVLATQISDSVWQFGINFLVQIAWEKQEFVHTCAHSSFTTVNFIECHVFYSSWYRTKFSNIQKQNHTWITNKIDKFLLYIGSFIMHFLYRLIIFFSL